MRRMRAIRGLFCLAVVVCRFLSAQTVETVSESFDGSGGVAVNRRGEVFVADFGITLANANGTTVKRILADGSTEIFATGLSGASGNDFDSQGNLFQSNIAGNRISRITPQGAVTTFAAFNIFGPVGVAVDPDDNVFVANCGGGSISRVTPQGASSIFAASPLLSCPNGLTLDQDGNLYTANFNNGSVIKIDPQGQVSNFAFIPGNGNGHLTFANGRLYVVGRNANQIFEVSLQGTVTLLAGAGALGAGPRGNADGPALQATFSIPNGIRASADGDTLYINSAVALGGSNLNPVVVRAIRGVLGLPETIHFPQFGNGDGFSSDIVVFNPSETVMATGDVVFWDPDGNFIDPGTVLASAADAQFELPPLASKTIATSGVGGLQVGSAVVRSDQPVSGVVRFVIPNIGIAGVGSAEPAAAVVAPVRREGALRTGMAIRNVGDQAIDVDLVLKDENGVEVADGRLTVRIESQGRIARFIEEFFPDADTTSFRGALCVRASDGGLVSVVALELGAEPGQFTTLPVSPLQP